MITSKVRQRIQELSSEYYARVQIIESKARQLLEFSQAGGHLNFTPHGLSHITAVEQNYDWLLLESDLKSFNSPELFCLLCATFFHDALMIPRRIGDEQNARENHIERARTFLLNNRELLGMSIHEVDAISEVIRAHGVYDLNEIPNRVVLGADVVDLRKLGACLSLADICHADSSRAPEIVLKHLELEPDSWLHWRRHLQISGITRDKDSILMSALTFSDEGRSAVEEYKKNIEAQLVTVRPYFDSILTPIKRVELMSKSLESPLDQTLQFKTNTPAILKLLIEGVYEREDVFIRELVQNSLDSCLLRRAKQQRRNLSYTPSVLLTEYLEDGRAKAFRIDDNGIGMDLSDIQDIVLWIGNSISSKSDVINLLQQTLGKNLIATFGIGLLSCFKASNKITIRTQKEKEQALALELTGVLDSVKPEKSRDTSIGTTIIVELSNDKADQIDLLDAVEYYFRMVQQVQLRILLLEWSPELITLTREEILKIAVTESDPVESYDYSSTGDISTMVEIFGEDFSGSIWISRPDITSLVGSAGSVDILNEGIFVVKEPTREWFPTHLSFCDAVLNFSSRSISLPAGRDRVIKNELFRLKEREIIEKSFGLIDVLVQKTDEKDAKKRDFAALVLANMYANANPDSRERILKRSHEFRVRRFKRDDRLSLKEVVASGKKAIFLQYSTGKFVSKLTVADGKQLYHHEDDFVELQAAIVAQENEIVVSTARADSERPVLEADLVKSYCRAAGFKPIDLTEVNVIKDIQKFRPVRDAVRKEIGDSTRFVEVNGLPNKKAWKVGNELWINLANPTMNNVYKSLQNEQLEISKLRLALILFSMMSYEIDSTVNKIATWLNE